mmetsp:Transcript_61209/g.68540  ORF Transcript_61209/g.68540 Transcript_61209/m.68540 type:complete len:225 (-) Transcript_61209:2-676(-)
MIGIPTISIDCSGVFVVVGGGGGTESSFLLEGKPSRNPVNISTILDMIGISAISVDCLGVFVVGGGCGVESANPVAHQMVASHPSTAFATSIGSVRLHCSICNLSSDENNSCAFSLFRTKPTTSTFRWSNSSTTNLPVLPVAPVTATFLTISLVGINDNSALLSSSEDFLTTTVFNDEGNPLATTGRRDNPSPLVNNPNKENRAMFFLFIMILERDVLLIFNCK